MTAGEDTPTRGNPMQPLQVSEDLLARVIAFKQVVETVIGEELTLQDYLDLLLQQAVDSMLKDLLEPLDPDLLLKSLQQLAAQYPNEVYGFVAETLRQGAAANAQEQVRRRLGFQPPDQTESGDD